MSWLDLFTGYLYVLKSIAIVIAVVIFISGLDDLFIDLFYWGRRAWRALTVYSRHEQMNYKALLGVDEKPLAIMVPAWQEHGVIGKMAQLAATTLDYENYHIFIGTYPNDPQTHADVEQVRAHFPNVHSVVCARPGPTSKADCLNNVLDAIFQFEQRSGIAFAGFILHDSEDVLSKLELRLFNFLVDRKDLIQLPVYPLERPLREFTGGHYLDEFAELHAKDIVVREALVGQVPSAGVGTCFSRRAITALLELGDGVAFDTQSLTEDYDIGFRLKQLGMREIFVRFPVHDADQPADPEQPRRRGRSAREASVICVREFFPDTLNAAVRQKSRWITGIVIQGFKTLRWTKSGVLNYFLWRDRKGALTNFASFLAMLLAMQLIAIWLYQRLVPDSYRFLSIFQGDWWLYALLAANFMLMLNRIVQRMFFVTSYYGIVQGLMSLPRLLWGNLVNFLANWRAIAQALQAKDIRRMAWAKTDHDFPMLGEGPRLRQPLGQILIAQGALTESQLQEALVRPTPGLRLGSALVHKDLISTAQLAAAVAQQAGVSWEFLGEHLIPDEIAALLPAHLALHYSVVPLREEGKTLILASESVIDPVSHAALERKLERPVRYLIAPKGEVTVELRRLYARQHGEPARELLAWAVERKRVSAEQAKELWKFYVSRQLMLGEVLQALGRIDTAVLNALLLRHEQSDDSLGQFLVNQGALTQATLDEALRLQQQLQVTMAQLLRRLDAAPIVSVAA
ncbi:MULTISPECIES: cyclic di-3',5'-guanylate-activated glycosyltransferase NrfB [Comamonas]|uniref:Glycosyl transferase family 2 n=1 Tax=Comamonas testosteroni TaxID=285 RepID=A0A096FPR3_COMTE|nr:MULTISPECIES: cyclic di-3',5'-guanylate-activated glycosyltransferase NrfB [Comamonas]KGH31934.1 glycosyl transferase family 2 [Comamonas testosteroni]MDN5502225.1 phage adsorption protein NrfB [Comamonas sp.]MDN5536393.1 phage adsorption protein NrfB [Comamonas sp.]MPT08700.1 phage adsorption protein NrfB [Comamonas sp.]